MRIKLDENLPVSLGAAISENRMIFTLDRGFGDIRAYPPGSHPGIVVLRLDDQSARAVTRAALAVVDRHDLDDLAGTVAIAQHGGLRVRRPSNGATQPAAKMKWGAGTIHHLSGGDGQRSGGCSNQV